MSDIVLRKKNINGFLREKSKSITKILSDRCSDTDFLIGCQLAISRNSDLQDCLKSEEGRESLANELYIAASEGLNPNPALQEIALIVFKGRPSSMRMKNGWIKLAMKHGIKSISCDIVKENDSFEIVKTSAGDTYHHKISLSKRGQTLGYYASCVTPDDQRMIKYMSLDEIVEWRNSYARSKGGAWETSFDGMALKTVIKALLRNLYLPDQLRAALTQDDIFEADGEIIDVSPVSAETLAEEMRQPAPDPEPVKTESKRGDLI